MVTAERAQAFGHLATAQGVRSLAIGENADAQSDLSTAIGNETVANGVDALAIGDTAAANGNSTTAVGGESVATGPGATAIGWQSVANAERAQAFGHLAQATGVRSTAVGEAAMALGAGSIAMGDQASAAADNSVAIGAGASATRANEFVLGNGQNTYRAAGIASQASTAAQSGPIGIVTSDAQGNLAVDRSIGTQMSQLDSRVRSLGSSIEDNKEGIAMAMALNTPYVPEDKTFAVSTSLGAFDGTTAMAASMGYRFNANTQLDAGVTYGFDRNQVGGRIGVTYAW